MEKLPLMKQAWTIAKIELKRAFFSRRAFWVYALALFPALIFLGRAAQVKIRHATLSGTVLAQPALMDSPQEGETDEAIIERLGKPAADRHWEIRTPFRQPRESGQEAEGTGITSHSIEPAVEARYVRLNISRPTYTFDRTARICELEVYGDDDTNLALNHPAVGSAKCSDDGDPAKAVNGNVQDFWCSSEGRNYLQVDLGGVFPIRRVVIKHAQSGGMPEELNTARFNIQTSKDNKGFEIAVNGAGARNQGKNVSFRRMSYFDGRREAVLNFSDGKLTSKSVNTLLDFEEDRSVFAGVFQLFYLRLAIFFGCLGIFMNLFRGEILDKTLHFWFLSPARREVLLVGKYGAGLIASSIIFAGGALLCFAVMMWPHNPVEVQAYLEGAGLRHAFLYASAAVMGCVGYGSVFLAAGLLLRNPIIPAAVLLAFESINSFLPEFLQKISVLHYLQSLCPVPMKADDTVPGLLQLLMAPAEPASRTGAVLGLIVLSAIVLWIAAVAVRRMEVSYSSE